MSVYLMYPGLPSVEIDWDVFPCKGEYVRSMVADKKTLWHTVTDVCYGPDATGEQVDMMIHLSEAHEQECSESPAPGSETRA